jgi:hypothetical protein
LKACLLIMSGLISLGSFIGLAIWAHNVLFAMEISVQNSLSRRIAGANVASRSSQSMPQPP